MSRDGHAERGIGCLNIFAMSYLGVEILSRDTVHT